MSRHAPDRPADIVRRAGLMIAATAGICGLAFALSRQAPVEQRMRPGLPGLTAEETAGGLVVTSVKDGSGAESAGIAAGDRILTIDGHRFPRLRLASDYITHTPHRLVRIGLQHRDQTRDVMLGRLEN